MGVLPAMGKLTREQAAIFLLLGYESKSNLSQQEESPNISYLPFYNSDLAFYRESFYAGLLYEKLEGAQSQCWILNAMPIGPRKNGTAVVNLTLMRQFVSAIQSEKTHQFKWHKDSHWNYQSVCGFRGYPETMLNPEKAWEGDLDRFATVNRVLKNSFSDRLSNYENDLSPAIKSALNWFED